MRYVVFIIAVACVAIGGCTTSENFTFKQQHLGTSAAPAWVWEPEYYNHKKGGYEFTQGYYRPVFNRKQHIRRSLKGYMYRMKKDGDMRNGFSRSKRKLNTPS